MFIKTKPLIEDYIYVPLDISFDENIYSDRINSMKITNVNKIFQVLDEWLKTNILGIIISIDEELINYPKELITTDVDNINSYLIATKFINNKYYGTLFDKDSIKKNLLFVPINETKIKCFDNNICDSLVFTVFDKDEFDSSLNDEFRSYSLYDSLKTFDNFFLLKPQFWYYFIFCETYKIPDSSVLAKRELNTTNFYSNHYNAIIVNINEDTNIPPRESNNALLNNKTIGEKLDKVIESIEVFVNKALRDIDNFMICHFDKKSDAHNSNVQKIRSSDKNIKISDIKLFSIDNITKGVNNEYMILEEIFDCYVEWCNTNNKIILDVELFVNEMEIECGKLDWDNKWYGFYLTTKKHQLDIYHQL